MQKNFNTYQTDVYLYYKAENNTASLDTFINVGGNSWLNDDHHTIYKDKEHFDNVLDMYTEVSELADILDLSYEQFVREVLNYLEVDDEYDFGIDYMDAKNYVKSRNDYMDKLVEVYNDYIDENYSEYAQEADEIISDWENGNLG